MKKIFANCVTHNEGIGKIGKEFLSKIDSRFEIYLKTIKEFWIHQPPSPELQPIILRQINRFSRSKNEELTHFNLHYTNLSFPFIMRDTGLPTVLETFWETDHLPDEWVEWSDDVDEIWLSTDFLMKMFKKSGVKSQKLKKLPFGIDRPKAVSRIFPEDNKVRFLFLSSFSYRKGIFFLIPAFLEEFESEEEVELILRSSPFGYSLHEMNLIIEKLNNSVKKSSKPIIKLIYEPVPEQKLWNLIFSCDALISPSFGEGFNRPVAEAMMLGKPPITTDIPPMNEFVSSNEGYLIKNLGLVPVTNMEKAGNFAEWFGQKYDHKWFQPSYDSLKEQMRQCYEDIKSGEIESKKQNLAKFAQFWDWSKFLTERIARLEALCE